eukprot:m51a1_g1050 hypothetical protein (244) ;mRNA; f:757650-758381
MHCARPLDTDSTPCHEEKPAYWLDEGIVPFPLLPPDIDGGSASPSLWPPMLPHMHPLPLPPLGTRCPLAPGIDERQGDLLASGADVVVHCANCQCHMGWGVARSIASAWPATLAADRRTPAGDARKLGHYSAALVAPGGPLVVNLYGQVRYSSQQQQRRHVSYSALRCGLLRLASALRRQLGAEGIRGLRVATYWLGCDSAGGDPAVVRGILEEALAGMHVTVWTLDRQHRNRLGATEPPRPR